MIQYKNYQKMCAVCYLNTLKISTKHPIIQHTHNMPMQKVETVKKAKKKLQSVSFGTS